jgi:hypothetical protein
MQEGSYARLEAKLVLGDAVDEVDLVVQREGPPAPIPSTNESNQMRSIQVPTSTSKEQQQQHPFRCQAGCQRVPERWELPEPGAAGDWLAAQRLHQLRQHPQRLVPPRRRRHGLPRALPAGRFLGGISRFAAKTSCLLEVPKDWALGHVHCCCWASPYRLRKIDWNWGDGWRSSSTAVTPGLLFVAWFGLELCGNDHVDTFWNALCCGRS